MFSTNVRKILTVTIAAAALCALTVSQSLAATSREGITRNTGGQQVTYTASGTFADVQLSGADLLELRGQPFSVTILGNTATKPTHHQNNWANFTNLAVSGDIYSGLVPNTPIPIPTGTTGAIQQAVSVSQDVFKAGFPFNDPSLGIDVNVNADFVLPAGTLTKPLMQPFSAIDLTPTNATVTYFDSTASTELAVASGTIVATVPGANERSANATASLIFLAGAPALQPRRRQLIG